jgi:hypothetical protein
MGFTASWPGVMEDAIDYIPPPFRKAARTLEN